MSPCRPVSPPRPCYPLLHLEDDPTVLRSVARLLSRDRCEVHGVATLSAARARLATRDDWCGVLADYHLPDGQGLDFVLEALVRLPAIPVRVVTGDDSSELANELHRARVACIRKPFDLCDLEPFLHEVEGFECSVRGPRVTSFAKGRDLTARECDVLRESLDVRSVRTIARRLDISVHTVRGYRTLVLRKAGASDFIILRARLFPERPAFDDE